MLTQRWRRFGIRLASLAGFAVLLGAPAQAALMATYDDGQVHIIDSEMPDGAVVNDSPTGDPTTVIVSLGGKFNDWVHVTDHSIFRLEGGSLATYVQGGDNAVLEIKSGSVSTFGPGGTGVSVYGSAVATITGGDIDGDVNAGPGGRIDLFGGSIQGKLFAHGDGVINVYGTGFNHPLGPLADEAGTLTGMLSDGTPLSVSFERVFRGTGTINLIPEPASLVLLSLGSLTMLRRRLSACASV